ncbi:SDR family NAD(P)-dependent oxidoreductase [Streptomyces antimicrobicus]|uniref:SDR family oxidoreductase n=1 Tax=Streptomyces antimicrobicus TaxID=2883108 RepID=A0ABS8BBQ6_9ACTN|nr:SDR family oxidoreductase [Streptomyces antimicrobicus]MCB5181966.1 SDR family oxidoreductase [Streptomyces antimicrobicus]
MTRSTNTDRPGRDTATTATTATADSPRRDDEFDGRVVLVTGGSRGMGLAAARRLLGAGAHVVITGRDTARLERATGLLREVSDGGRRLLAVRADAASTADLDRLTATVGERHGRLDGVFANAGVGSFRPAAEVSEADFDHVVGVNFKGVFFTVQKSLPLLDAAGPGGSVVVNASWTLYRGMPHAPVYSAAKAAVHNLTHTLGSDLAGRGIRVNSVSPGYIVTDMFRSAVPDETAYGALRAEVPLGRLGEAEDVAETVAFLLSARSAYITGQDIAVDGGLVSVVPSGR